MVPAGISRQDAYWAILDGSKPFCVVPKAPWKSSILQEAGDPPNRRTPTWQDALNTQLVWSLEQHEAQPPIR